MTLSRRRLDQQAKDTRPPREIFSPSRILSTIERADGDNSLFAEDAIDDFHELAYNIGIVLLALRLFVRQFPLWQIGQG
jgi:hypothetical protein